MASGDTTGLRSGTEVGIAIDVAATQLATDGGYPLRHDGATLTRDRWCARLVGWTHRFPIVSIEDPFAEDDAEGMAMLVTEIGSRVQVVGDDFLVTDAAREAARAHGLTAVVSTRSGETEDVTIAHLAVGWGADGVKVGSLTRGERTAKWNEMPRIEEDLGTRARFAGAVGLWPAGR
ncbi:hypothetical protein [Actinophytocola oryzae]|uniref:hypothetical protein n=1 Tax=Actinophytocola oryzae TaxID=502181 RepID=UPI001AAE2E00|nr:hypothetical protein [Actinophytocola oryzae]